MFKYQVLTIDLVTGWHLTTTKEGQIIHSINVQLEDGRQTYGTLWLLGVPIQKDAVPTPIPQANPEEFWLPAPKLSELIDPLFTNNVKILNKLASESRLFAVVSNGHVENIAVFNGEGWYWAANFRKADRQEREDEANALMVAYLDQVAAMAEAKALAEAEVATT